VDRHRTRTRDSESSKATTLSELRFPAWEVRQGPKRVLYSFAVDGKVLPRFSTVSRIRRESDHKIHGYQRPEVLSHIGQIRNYLESEDPMLPNNLIIAFDRRVYFEPGDVQPISPPYTRVGTIVIPADESLPESARPGWIVDGQQRAAAMREADLESFPVLVTAFITDDSTEQREQFILVNSTKPLPKGLIYELLPVTESKLPSLLERRRFPAYLLSRLNHDEDSPLCRLIHTPTNPDGLIKDSAILRLIENSETDGGLYRIQRAGLPREHMVENMLSLIKSFWSAAREVFANAWGLTPRRSRLMHGAGIVSMGFIMDTIAGRYRRTGLPSEEQFGADLKELRKYCRWTEGYWEFNPPRRWNEIQNTSKDIKLLSDYLLDQYRKHVWNWKMEASSAG
jgi:DGQHR domain-containing protein